MRGGCWRGASRHDRVRRVYSMQNTIEMPALTVRLENLPGRFLRRPAVYGPRLDGLWELSTLHGSHSHAPNRIHNHASGPRGSWQRFPARFCPLPSGRRAAPGHHILAGLAVPQMDVRRRGFRQRVRRPARAPKRGEAAIGNLSDWVWSKGSARGAVSGGRLGVELGYVVFADLDRGSVLKTGQRELRVCFLGVSLARLVARSSGGDISFRTRLGRRLWYLACCLGRLVRNLEDTTVKQSQIFESRSAKGSKYQQDFEPISDLLF